MERNELGQFVTGNSGKPKGSLSYLQRTTREKLWKWLEPQLDTLDEVFKELSSKEKARFIARVLPFFLPRQIHAEIEMPEHTRPKIDYSKLSPSTLKEILHATELGTGDNPGDSED